MISFLKSIAAAPSWVPKPKKFFAEGILSRAKNAGSARRSRKWPRAAVLTPPPLSAGVD